jgi:hypothetical protein
MSVTRFNRFDYPRIPVEYNAKVLVTFGSLTPDCQIRHLQRWIWQSIASKPGWLTTCPTVLRYTHTTWHLTMGIYLGRVAVFYETYHDNNPLHPAVAGIC